MQTIESLVKTGSANQPALAARLQRAAEILRSDPPRRVYRDARLWHVPSVGRPGVVYLVDRLAESCTCPDYRQHKNALADRRRHGPPGGWCKHRLAVEMLCRLLGEPEPQPVNIEQTLLANAQRLA